MAALLLTIQQQWTGARAAWAAIPRPDRLRLRACALWLAVATLIFIRPLSGLMVYASGNHLNSHIPLVPVVAAYLLWIRRRTLPETGPSSIAGALLMTAGCAAALGAALRMADTLTLNDRLALFTTAYLCIVAAGGFLCLGARWMAAAALPVTFLLFMVPLPDAAVRWLETESMLASADAAAWFFDVTGTPMFRDGTVLALPGIVLRVAEECSGIRSSWVLFITSVVASDLYLHSSWRKLLLVLFVIPLGIVRNGFRILVIGLLCVHIGPHMIDSVIHRQGGPLFFALSLVPLLALAVWLRRQEQRA